MISWFKKCKLGKDTIVTLIKLIGEGQASEDVKKIYNEVKERYKLDFVPAVFQAWANQPAKLQARWNVTKAAEERLGMEQFHLIGLCTAITTGCGYCMNFHSRILQDQGYSSEHLEYLTEIISGMAASDLYANSLQLRPDVIPTQARLEAA